MDTMPLKIETIQTRAAVTPETFTVEPHPTTAGSGTSSSTATS